VIARLQVPADLRWDDVRVFLALHRERSLSAAGARIGLDGSTLSRRLVALEGELEARLFDRTREGLVPTAAAEMLLPAAEEMEAAHARFARAASGFEREIEGTVRLSVPPGFAELFVRRTLARLYADHPRLRIELDVSLRVLDLTRREADLAVRTVRPVSGELVIVKLETSVWTPMTALSRATRGAPVRRWDEVPWIAWTDELSGIPPERWRRKHAASAVSVLRTSDLVTQAAAVEAGLGVALLPASYAHVSAVRPLRYARALEPSASELPSNELWLVGHSALRSVPRVSAVWDLLVADFQNAGRGAPARRRRAR
jgi:DNA-binding transcriptional LysR family regulator